MAIVTVPFTTSAALVLRVGAETVTQLFDDDGDGVADTAPLNACIEDANRLTEARLLHKGFSHVQLSGLAVDATLCRLATEIALGLAGRRRPEWITADGRGRYDAIATAAKADLDLIAQGRLRLAAEGDAGANTSIRGSIRTPEPVFVFAASGANTRGPGGF